MSTHSKQRSYADLDAALYFNPMTEDLALKTNQRAIAFSVKNLILTMNGERPFNHNIGTPIRRLLFELFGPVLDIVLRKLIAQVLSTYEPRIEVKEILIDSNTDAHSITVTIKYILLSTTTPHTIDVVLTRTR